MKICNITIVYGQIAKNFRVLQENWIQKREGDVIFLLTSDY